MKDQTATERIIEWARMEMANHGEHCDCDLCAAFFDLDYPATPAAQTQETKEK